MYHYKAAVDKGIGQYFAALINMGSVGIMGDERIYDYAIALDNTGYD